MTNFAELAWERTDHIYNSILKMQFIQELENGSLNPEIFKHYIVQDAVYLGEFARTLSLISAKAPTAELQLQFACHSQDALVVERSLHEDFFNEFV